MNEDERNIEQQEIVLDSLAKLMAGFGAMRQCMTAVIASHPDPAQLRHGLGAQTLGMAQATALASTHTSRSAFKAPPLATSRRWAIFRLTPRVPLQMEHRVG